MGQPILAAQRITRIHYKTLGDIRVTFEAATNEAEMSRGLFIGSCRAERLVTHLCYAIRNALPACSIVVPLSYAMSEVVTETLLEDHQIPIWQAIAHSRKGTGNATAPVQVAIPEKLFLIGQRVRHGEYRPMFIHVIGLSAFTSLPGLRLTQSLISRLQNVARCKAVCHARGLSPYAIIWTVDSCGEIFPSRIHSAIGVDAWLYADGRTLRTAAFASLENKEALSL